MKSMKRVVASETMAIYSAVACGVMVTLMFILFPSIMVGLFLDGHNDAVQIATDGLSIFSCAFIFFIFNLTAIGYFQSIEKVLPAIVFALLRGLVFLIPSFLFVPELFGITGIWLSLFVSELLTSVCIVIYYLYNHYSRTQRVSG